MSDVIQDQPNPVPNDRPAIWSLVIEDMQERDRIGRERYGTPLQPFNGRKPLVDAMQEILDLTAYIRQEIAEAEVLRAEVVSLKRLCRTCAFCNTELPSTAELKAHCGQCEPHPLAQENRWLRKELRQIVGDAAKVLAEIQTEEFDSEIFSLELEAALEDLAITLESLEEYREVADA